MVTSPDLLTKPKSKKLIIKDKKSGKKVILVLKPQKKVKPRIKYSA